jgi:hypothetical protein
MGRRGSVQAAVKRGIRERLERVLSQPGPRGSKKAIAEALEIPERTARDWRRKAVLGRRKPGRPRTPREERREAFARVEEETHRRKKAPGWRQAHENLGIPVRLAQETVRTFKRLQKRRAREGAMARRVSVKVHYRDVLWAEDGAQFGRVEGEPFLAEVLRDVATTKTLAVTTGPAPTGDDITALLHCMKTDRGTLPLVLGVDNGGAQKSNDVAAYCEAEKVIVLRNHPRTPQHNAFVERAIRELKEESGLASDSVLRDEDEGTDRLQAAWRRLDNLHKRPRHGYRTASEVDAAAPGWYPKVDRARFYAAARKAIEEAVSACSKPRARRLAEREAIFRTLEDFGLISRTRGGQPFTRSEPATIS